jgi:hypothetical protein
MQSGHRGSVSEKLGRWTNYLDSRETALTEAPFRTAIPLGEVQGSKRMSLQDFHCLQRTEQWQSAGMESGVPHHFVF